VFQTSRYPTFAAQIDSWILEEEGGAVLRGAVYDIEVDLDAAKLAAATAVVTDPSTSSDDLKQRFADPFDRLIDGIFEIGALPPAVTTEFNVIRLRGEARVLGILVRNPEPFNDPKIPAAELEQTVTLAIESGSEAAHRGLHAKDAARVFVTNTDGSMDVPAGAHHFTFQYRRWNGTAHAIDSIAAAEFARS
jgi:threonine dehydrogenase-like Zn-dependent dehydrogenase